MSSPIQEGWHLLPLGEIADSRRGITYSAEMLESRENGLPYLNMKSFLKGGGFNSNGTKSYSGTYTTNDLIGDHDLLIANTDVTAGDIVGAPALLPKEFAEAKAVYSHHVTRLRLNEVIIVPFLYYLLCLPEYRSHMLRVARGTTVLMLDMHAIKRISIIAPESKAEQRRIAEILTTLDETIVQTEALITKYQQIKAGLMHDLFTRGVTPDGRLRPTRDQAPHLYKESPLGWIPKEWEPANIRSLTSLCIDCPHTTPVLSGDGYLMARTSEIRNGKFYVEQSPRVPPVEYRSRVSRGAPSEGDIIFTREAPVGEAFVVPANLEICLGQRVMLMRPLRNRCDSIFLLFQIYSDRVQREFSRITGGTTNPHLNVDDVRKFIVSLPNPSEQVEIAKRLTVAADFINSEEAKVDKLRHQKFGLMQDLLTGRVRVAI